jgi:TP901 family phage tail tape measure protein
LALTKDVVIRLLGDASSAQKAIKAAADAAEVSVAAYRRAEREQSKQAAAAEAAAKRQHEAMQSIGRGASLMGAVIVAGLGLATKAAIDWESAWAGVLKVIDETPAETDRLEAGLRGLATELPATHEEIAGVAEAAGQLGVTGVDNILKFTKTAIALGVSTNLSAEDAANGLARLGNVMGIATGDVDRMGATLVALGNAGASTESDILAMSLRIAAAGNQANMSAGDVMGIANAMSSMGIEAEAGGTAISRVIKDINSDVLSGGGNLAKYAALAGQSADQFAASWRDNAAGALTAVAAGIGRVTASGGDASAVLADLGLKDVRVADTMLRLASNSQLLGDSLRTGNTAWAENSALVNEAARRYATTASQLQIAQNTITDAAIDIGGTFLPALASAASVVADLARGFQMLPGPVKAIVTVLGAAAGGLTLVGGAAIIAVPKLVAFRTTMTTLASSSTTAVSTIGRFGTIMAGPWGLAIGAGITVLGGLIAALGATGGASEDAASYTDDLTGALKESNGAINDNIRALAAQKAADTAIGDSNLLAVAKAAGISLPTVTDALLGNRHALDEVNGALDAYGGASVTFDENGNRVVNTLSTQNRNAEEARAKFGELAPALALAGEKNKDVAAATKETGDAQAAAADTTAALAGAMSDSADATDSAADAAKGLSDALDALNGPALNAREAARQLQEAYDAAAKSIAENGRNLDVTTEAGRNNQEALDGIAKAAMDQANAIAASGGSYDAFRNSLESSRQNLIATAVRMGATKEEAQTLADQILAIPDAAEVDIRAPAASEVIRQLQTVANKVRDIPPGKTVNVGVLSQAAIERLQAVGYKVRTLPDGSVEVTANTGPARAALDALTRPRIVPLRFRIENPQAAAQAGALYRGPRQAGGPVGPGGIHLVGEAGPELVAFGAHGYVTPAGLSRAAYGAAVGPGMPVGATAGRPGPIQVTAPVTAQVRVYVGNREITDIARVEATTAVDQHLGAVADQLRYAGA